MTSSVNYKYQKAPVEDVKGVFWFAGVAFWSYPRHGLYDRVNGSGSRPFGPNTMVWAGEWDAAKIASKDDSTPAQQLWAIQ